MPWNGIGVFSRIYSWVADRAAGIDISSTRMDADSNDIVTAGLGNCLTRDGQGQPTANLPMATFRHTNVGNGVIRNDYAALGQVQDALANWAVATGSSDALAASYTPAITAVVDGQMFFLRATAANTTIGPTFSPNGLGPYTITKNGGAALAANDIAGNLDEIVLRYNLANTRFELLNPSISGIQPSLIPTGSIVSFPAASPPSGWFGCNGSAIPRTGVGAALFALCGTTFGSGDGSTTFNLPDLRGRVPAGVDAGIGRLPGLVLAGTTGSQTNTLATTNLPPHVHTGTTGDDSPDHLHATAIADFPTQAGLGTSGGGLAYSSSALHNYNSGGASARHQHAFTTGSGPGASSPFTVVQPTLGMYYHIKG